LGYVWDNDMKNMKSVQRYMHMGVMIFDDKIFIMYNITILV
jgi:hypothetical protein